MVPVALLSRKRTSCGCGLQEASSRVAPLVKLVVTEVLVVWLLAVADGLRWLALARKLFMGRIWGLGRGLRGLVSSDRSMSVRPLRAERR